MPGLTFGLEKMINKDELRQRAAIEAMGSYLRGMLCNNQMLALNGKLCESEGISMRELVANRAVGYADALVNELEKTKL